MIKNKKKISTLKTRVNPKKTITNKIIKQHEKTSHTTKEMTYATMEQTVQNQDGKLVIKNNPKKQQRMSYLQRMQANRLSPFSSIDGRSLTPKIKKSISPHLPKQNKKQKKLIKTKKKIIGNSKPNTARMNKKNNKTYREDHSNSVLEMEAKRITQLTEEQHQLQNSIRKCPIQVIYSLKKLKLRKSKGQAIGWMRARIISNYIKIYPTMTMKEINIISAVIVIQRLWRQSKVKRIINEYLSPRTNTITYTNTFGKDNNQWLKNCRQVSKHQDQVLQLSSISLDKQLSTSKLKITEQHTPPCYQQTYAIIQNAQLIKKPIQTQAVKLNLFDLQLSSELSLSKPAKEKILRFVDCFRELNLSQRKSKKQRKNVFNLPQSLSQKCLMQKFYRKAFKYTQKQNGKCNELSLFPLKKVAEKQQRALKLSEPKVENFDMEQRFYTQQQDEGLAQKNNKVLQITKNQFKNIEVKAEKKPKQNTIQTISQISQQIIQFLLVQFLEQFGKKPNKSNLKKRRLPGLKISKDSIQKYLKGMIAHTLKNYTPDVQQGLLRINAATFLKHYRIQIDEDLFATQQDQMCDWNIIPNSVFFEYQQIFEREYFLIDSGDQKYTNFLLGLVKIHNKSLIDCFVQLLQKFRTQNIYYPWDSKNKNSNLSFQYFSKQIIQIEKQICQLSFRRLGRLHRKNDQQQQQNLRNNDKQQYRKQGLDWDDRDQRLQVRQQLSNQIWEQIIRQTLKDIQQLICQ